MKLRRWQAECIAAAFNQFSSENSHFLCLATPGAGKTMMSSQLAKKLFESDSIDLVICFSPSSIVSSDFKEELERQTNRRFDGKLGSHGCSITYQAMLGLSNDFWQLFAEYRIFVIFDEVHHCAGSSIQDANAWGERIISKIQGKASFTLALTGTPWRSDSVPIALASYGANHDIRCNYSYGLGQAIKDGVCRTPCITLIDNDQIEVSQGDDINKYYCFSDLLKQADCSYQNLVESDALMLYMLRKANEKLIDIRSKTPDAGALIVASSVAHARRILQIIHTEFNDKADIATYQEDDALGVIQNYKYSTTKWIISVGMISEGTNLPRLRVCCHLTRVKTELYFRQILGRILRASGKSNDKGFLFIPAEPTLVEYANRVAEDIPEANVVKFDTIANGSPGTALNGNTSDYFDSSMSLSLGTNDQSRYPIDNLRGEGYLLSQSYEASLNIFGRFKHEVVKFDGIPYE